MIGLMAALASAALPQQFDLDCKGTLNAAPNAMARGGYSNSWTGHFRMDLTAKTWCEADCRSVSSIEMIDNAQIVIRNDRPEPGMVWVIRLDRNTGEYFERNTLLAENAYNIDGRCHRLSFSKFPEPQPDPAARPPVGGQ